MTHILFLTQWYPTRQSPVNGIFIQEHARAISIYNQVTVLHIQGISTSPGPRMNPTMESDQGMTTYRLAYAKSPIPKTTWIRQYFAVDQIVRLLINAPSPPELIQANIYNTAGLAVFLGSRYNLPVILSENASTYPRDLFSKTQIFRIRFLLNQMDLILPVTENLKHHMLRYKIRGPYRCIPNTVNTRLFFPDRDKINRQSRIYRMLAVAGLNEVKGIDFLLKAVARLSQIRNDFELLIVGDGPERDTLNTLVSSLNISEFVRFAGQLGKNEISEIMRSSDLMVLTSRWDNQPVVLLEAMACGLPVLASEVGGIPEIVKPFCGVLVPPGDLQRIAQGLNHILNNLGEYDSRRIAEYAAQTYSYETVGKMFSDVYSEVIREFSKQRNPRSAEQ
jgi:L-malate glycosyltransferase